MLVTGWDGGALALATIRAWHGGRLPVDGEREGRAATWAAEAALLAVTAWAQEAEGECADLRNALARAEAARDDERTQRLLYEDDIRGYVADIDRLTAARDMARATLDAERLAGRAELERERARVQSHAALLRYAALLRRVAHEVLRHPGELDTCQRDDCPGLRRAVARAGAVTGGDDGGR